MTTWERLVAQGSAHVSIAEMKLFLFNHLSHFHHPRESTPVSGDAPIADDTHRPRSRTGHNPIQFESLNKKGLSNDYAASRDCRTAQCGEINAV
jgi:hypothetical protein